MLGLLRQIKFISNYRNWTTEENKLFLEFSFLQILAFFSSINLALTTQSSHIYAKKPNTGVSERDFIIVLELQYFFYYSNWVRGEEE